MRSTERKSEAGRYAVAKKLFAIVAEHSADEIERAAEVVQGNEALMDVLHRLAEVRKHEESPTPSSSVAPVNGSTRGAEEPPPLENGDPWTLRRPSYLTEEDMLDMLRRALSDPLVPKEELLGLPKVWQAKPARGLENEKGRPALALALHNIFESQFPSPADRIVRGFGTLYMLAKSIGRESDVVRRLRHDVESRFVANILMYSNVYSLASVAKKWRDQPLPHAPDDSRADVSKRLIDDLLEKTPNTSEFTVLMTLLPYAAKDAMDALIARHRIDQAKARHGTED
jgi:hypothetical protein